VNPGLKNLREWVLLLFVLFCVLSIAGVQYGMMLAAGASPYPNPDLGQVVSMTQGPRGAWYTVYVTAREYRILNAVLGVAALSLLASLGLIVGHGVRHLRASHAPAASSRRKR
jgi:hypothetical protein